MVLPIPVEKQELVNINKCGPMWFLVGDVRLLIVLSLQLSHAPHVEMTLPGTMKLYELVRYTLPILRPYHTCSKPKRKIVVILPFGNVHERFPSLQNLRWRRARSRIGGNNKSSQWHSLPMKRKPLYKEMIVVIQQQAGAHCMVCSTRDQGRKPRDPKFSSRGWV